MANPSSPAPMAIAVFLLAIRAAAAASASTDGWYAPQLDSLPPNSLIDLGSRQLDANAGATTFTPSDAQNSSNQWTVHASAGPGRVNCSTPVPATVPGDIYTDLHAAGVIDDPLSAFGDWKTAWAGRTSWTYTRSFTLTPPQAATVRAGAALLVIEGVETNATVWFNGVNVITATDSWMRYTAEVQSLLHPPPASNNVTVAIRSVYDACEFSDPSHANVTCPNRVYVRQAASSWGWDWAKRYSPQGIWRPIYVAILGAVPPAVSHARREPTVTMGPDSPPPVGENRATNASGIIGGATLKLSADEKPSLAPGNRQGRRAGTTQVSAVAAVTALSAVVRPADGQPAQALQFDVEALVTIHASAPCSVTVSVSGNWSDIAVVHQSFSVQQGESTQSLRLTAQDVELWWPVGYGAQPLYRLSASVSIRGLASNMSRAIGFRTVRLQTDAGASSPGDAQGSGNTSMILVVNGLRVLVRGSSLVPLDTFNGRTSETAARRLLRSTVAANMNTLRVWGGGTFLPPRFYDLCDEMGVMLMHDFMLSWYPNVPYPAFPAYLERLAAEVKQVSTALARHPSIVLWNGGNEDQCTKYDPKRSDACRPGSTFWYPNCTSIYEACIAVYIDTVLQTAAAVMAVPVWPVSPSAGWESGVDRATGVPTGARLVEKDDAVSTVSRWNQGALDVHGPYAAPHQPNSLLPTESQVLFHSEFGELGLPQFETLVKVLPDPAMWPVTSSAQAQRSPNGAARTVAYVTAMFGPNLANFSATTEAGYRRVAYLSQLAQSEGLRAVVDGGRFGAAVSASGNGGVGRGNSTRALTDPGRALGRAASGPLDRPWGYLFWQLNDVTQGLSWGSLEYGGRFKIAHYAAKDWFAPVRVSCHLLTGNGEQISSGHMRSPGHDHTPKWVGHGSANSSPLVSRNCTYQPNTDYGGDGRAVPNVKTKEACCSQCMADARCVVGVLAGNTCWFKYSSDKPRSKPGVVACKVPPSPPVQPAVVACTVANDGATAWTGPVTLITQSIKGRDATVWAEQMQVGPVAPGHALTFFRRNTTGALCPASVAPCWLYGQPAAGVSQPTFGLPLTPFAALVKAGNLPTAVVTATVDGVNNTAAVVELNNDPSSAAFYVHLTSAVPGQFTEAAFHLQPRERRFVTFWPWDTESPLDPVLFQSSLRVHWLNADTRFH